MRLKLVAVALAAVLGCAGAALGLDVPASAGLVNDQAGVMSTSFREALEQKLRAYEQETGREIAVLTVPSLGGQAIEDYAQSVFVAWGIGKKDRDNGVLLLIAPTDRASRIHVGYGLEPMLTDIASGRILRDRARPFFKAGKVEEGIASAVDGILETLNRSGETEASVQPSAKKKFSLGWLFLALALVVIAAAIMLAVGSESTSSYSSPARTRRADSAPRRRREREPDPGPDPAFYTPVYTPPVTTYDPPAPSWSSDSGSDSSSSFDFGGGDSGGGGSSDSW